MVTATRRRQAPNVESPDDLVQRYRSDRTLARLLGFFIMANRDLVVIDALSPHLEIPRAALRAAAAKLERDGFIEYDGESTQKLRCRLTRDRGLCAIARGLVGSIERSAR